MDIGPEDPAQCASNANPSHRAVAAAATLLAVSVVAVIVWLVRQREFDALTTMGSMVAVGAVICWKRPNERVGWLLVVAGLLFGTSSAAIGSIAVVNDSPSPPPFAVFGAWLDEWVWIPTGTLTFVVLPMLLPDGQPTSPAFGRVLKIILLAMAAWSIAAMFSSQLADEIDSKAVGIANPIGILPLEDVEKPPTSGYLLTTLAASIVVAAISLVVRYRRSSGRERTQLRWIAYGTLTAILGSAALVAAPLPQSTRDWSSAVFQTLMPLSIGVAVLRHNLYDIDRLISRTVGYSAVTALLAATYLALVFVIRAAVPLHGDLAVAASTLTVAALFNPLRYRVQRKVDRRFYRARYDAARTIDAFADRLRTQFDLTALAHDLQTVVESTMQPTSVSLWLHHTNAQRMRPSGQQPAIRR